MEPNFEQPKETEPSPVLEKKEFKEFIERRNIAPEDFSSIEKIAQLPRQTLIANFHNLFSLSHERSNKEVEALIRTEANPEIKEIYETILAFCDKYGWMACHDLIRTLEK